MNGFSPFLKKEFFELYRKGRLLLFGILFVFFGIEAPALAKLTPVLFKMMSDEFEQQGVIIKDVTSTAATSWEQFFGNLPVILIVFVIVFASSVTSEFSSGSIIPLLTKGLSRTALMLSKLTSALITWSAGLWLCFGITYAYTAYFWKDSSVQSLIPTLLLWWLYSVMVICLMFIVPANTHSGDDMHRRCGLCDVGDRHCRFGKEVSSIDPYSQYGFLHRCAKHLRDNPGNSNHRAGDRVLCDIQFSAYRQAKDLTKKKRQRILFRCLVHFFGLLVLQKP